MFRNVNQQKLQDTCTITIALYRKGPMPDTRETPEKKVSCDVCRKEIAASEAINAEAQDYVLYFCNPDCYEIWRKESSIKLKRDAMLYTPHHEERSPLIRLIWRGEETMQMLPELLKQAEQIEVTLPASYNHSLFKALHPGASPTEPEKLSESGGPDLLHEIAAVSGLEELDQLSKKLHHSGATVCLFSPPTLVLTLHTCNSGQGRPVT